MTQATGTDPRVTHYTSPAAGSDTMADTKATATIAGDRVTFYVREALSQTAAQWWEVWIAIRYSTGVTRRRKLWGSAPTRDAAVTSCHRRLRSMVAGGRAYLNA